MLGRGRHQFSYLQVAPLFTVALLGLAAPGAPGAADPAPSPLTPGLATLATPAVAAEPAAAQAEAIGLPAEGPGSLAREGERVIVEAHFEAGVMAQVEALEAAGAKVLTASGRYQAATLSVEPEDLTALAAVPGLSTVAPSRRPVYYGAAEVLGTSAVTSNGLCEGGSVISQGLEQLNVPAARAAFGARGAGQTIGVISDSFDSATESIEGGQIATDARDDEVSNDLPGHLSTCSGQQVPVDVIAEAPAPGPEEEPATDEGRAMIQVVHDLAPHARLAFATADPSELAFAENIERLAAPVAAGGAGADVIVDDVSYLAEPFFQEGPVAVAIQNVKAEGVTYLTAAGNDNLFEGTNEIGSWEAPAYRPMACPKAVAELPDANLPKTKAPPNCMDFNPGTGAGEEDSTFRVTVEPEELLLIDLQWAEPWYGVETDLNAYLLNEAGEIISEEPFINFKSGSSALPIPVEVPFWQNETKKNQKVQLVIGRCSGTCDPKASGTATPRLKFIFAEDGRGVVSTEYPESKDGDIVGPTVYGHAGSGAAITLGAIRYSQSASAPKEPERYSSRGPVTHYFGPVTSTTPAAKLSTPETLQKPNLTATDCAATTFFAELRAGIYEFCGTSESGPHAAAVAALMKQTDPLATPAAILAAMETSTTKYTPTSQFDKVAATGAGLLNAAAAITALGGSPVDDPPSSVVAALEEGGGGGATRSVTSEPEPTVTITKGPKALSNEKRPTFEFTSSQPGSFTCQLDAGTAQPCASPYTVPTALADGTHGFVVTVTDSKGRSGSSGVDSFTIDTKAPRTTIVGHPKKVVRTSKRDIVARFRLESDEAPVTFYCQVDREPLRICGSLFHRRFTVGRHVLKVRAKDAAGNLATKLTTFHFRVMELRPAPQRRSRRSAG